jgi:hypothetical protein
VRRHAKGTNNAEMMNIMKAVARQAGPAIRAFDPQLRDCADAPLPIDLISGQTRSAVGVTIPARRMGEEDGGDGGGARVQRFENLRPMAADATE